MIDWDREVLIKEISKNNRGDVIRIRRLTKGNNTYIDIRVWYSLMQAPYYLEELRPGEGVSIPEGLVEEVSCAMQQSAANYLISKPAQMGN